MRYSHDEQVILRVDVDVALAVNAKEVAAYEAAQSKAEAEDQDGDAEMKDKDGQQDREKVLAIVPLSRLLSKYLAAQLVADWLSTVSNFDQLSELSGCRRTGSEARLLVMVSVQSGRRRPWRVLRVREHIRRITPHNAATASLRVIVYFALKEHGHFLKVFSLLQR